MRKSVKIRAAVVFLALAAALLISLVFTLSFGSSDVSPKAAYGVLMDQLFRHGKETAAGIWSRAEYQIIWNIRLPRVLFGMLCGAGLSVCDAAMQALVMNPIADPYILGISSGASAGAAWALLMPVSLFSGQYEVVLTAMLGAMIAASVVYTMARIGSGGQIKPVTLLLSGTAVNAVMSAVTSLLIFLAKSPESISAVYNWQMGSIAAAMWTTLPFPSAAVLAGTVIFSCCGSRFNLLMMGEEDARSMGLNTRLFRNLMFLMISLVVASLVSVTGIIGFVGLMIPHLVRLLAGTSDNRIVIPYSAILGALFLIWADAIARGMFGSAELPIGIITAFIGAPFFMYLMIRSQHRVKA